MSSFISLQGKRALITSGRIAARWLATPLRDDRRLQLRVMRRMAL